MKYGGYESKIHGLAQDPADTPCQRVGFARCQILCEKLAAEWDREKADLEEKISGLVAQLLRAK